MSVPTALRDGLHKPYHSPESTLYVGQANVTKSEKGRVQSLMSLMISLFCNIHMCSFILLSHEYSLSTCKVTVPVLWDTVVTTR
jgi:hypothetical protein